MEYTQKQLQEKYKSLPEDLKDAIFGVQSAEIIQNISKKHHLQIDQMGELAAETGLVLLGLTKPEDYIKNLSNRLKINIKDARDIALEVNIEIFSKVKESLKKLHGIGAPAENSENNKTSEKTADNTYGNKNEATRPVKITETQTSAEKVPVKISNENKTENSEEIAKNFNFPKGNNKKIEYVAITNPDKIKSEEPDKKITPEFPPLPPYSKNIEKREEIKTNPQKMQIERYAKQITEIDLEKENKEIKITTEKYPSGDPYKEPM